MVIRVVNLKDGLGMIDTIEIIHTNGKTGKVTKHTYGTGFWFKLAVKLHLKKHAVIINYGTGGIKDVMSWISGLASPTAYTYLGIGTGTSAATSTDTEMTGTSTYRANVVPTYASTSDSYDDEIQWTHTFSHANDSYLTGTWAVNEVCIGNVANAGDAETAGHMLVHIAGSGQYGAADNCIWGNGDTLQITVTLKGEQGS